MARKRQGVIPFIWIGVGILALILIANNNQTDTGRGVMAQITQSACTNIKNANIGDCYHDYQITNAEWVSTYDPPSCRISTQNPTSCSCVGKADFTDCGTSTTTKYACISGTCQVSASGTYTSNTCGGACTTTKYACISGTCQVSASGTYTSNTCGGACNAVTPSFSFKSESYSTTAYLGQPMTVNVIVTSNVAGSYVVEVGLESSGTQAIIIPSNSCNPDETWYANKKVDLVVGDNTIQFTSLTPKTLGYNTLHFAVVTACGGTVLPNTKTGTSSINVLQGGSCTSDYGITGNIGDYQCYKNSVGSWVLNKCLHETSIFNPGAEYNWKLVNTQEINEVFPPEGIFECRQDRYVGRELLCTVNANCGTADEDIPLPQGCVPDWTCNAYGSCNNGIKTRVCTDSEGCGVTTDKPSTTENCGECVGTTTKTCQDIDGCAAQQICSNGVWQTCAKKVSSCDNTPDEITPDDEITPETTNIYVSCGTDKIGERCAIGHGSGGTEVYLNNDCASGFCVEVMEFLWATSHGECGNPMCCYDGQEYYIMPKPPKLMRTCYAGDEIVAFRKCVENIPITYNKTCAAYVDTSPATLGVNNNDDYLKGGIGITFDDVSRIPTPGLLASLCYDDNMCENTSKCYSISKLKEEGAITDTRKNEILSDNRALGIETGAISGAVIGGVVGGVSCAAAIAATAATAGVALPLSVPVCFGLGATAGTAGGGLLGDLVGRLVDNIKEENGDSYGYCIKTSSGGDFCQYMTWAKPIGKAINMEESYCMVGIAIILLGIILIFMAMNSGGGSRR